MSILNMYMTDRDGIREIDKLRNYLWYSKKDYLGEVLVQDSAGCLWEIKVRNTQNRGRYLKIKSKSNESLRIRATANSYKEYVRITFEEWEVFYLLANSQINQELYYKAKRILDRLF